MAKCKLSDWQAEGLRLSAFVVQPIDPATTRFWEPLLGEPPSNINSQPRQQLVREEGPLLDGMLSVQINPSRVDWRLVQDPNNISGGLPTVGPYDATVSGFRDLMLRWLVQCPPIKRLAFGAVMLLRVGSMPDAYAKLSELLPAVEIDAENARDLIYRINRRRFAKCGIEDLLINRISTWQVVHLTGVEIELGSAGAPPPTVKELGERLSVCRLELDINTAPEFGHELRRDIVPALFGELIDLGSEIAAEGDIR